MKWLPIAVCMIAWFPGEVMVRGLAHEAAAPGTPAGAAEPRFASSGSLTAAFHAGGGLLAKRGGWGLRRLLGKPPFPLNGNTPKTVYGLVLLPEAWLRVNRMENALGAKPIPAQACRGCSRG